MQYTFLSVLFALLFSIQQSTAQPFPRPDVGGKPENKVEVSGKEEVKKKPQTLDDLFRRLKNAEDEAEADGISRLIERRLTKSGSPTADLLMKRAQASAALGQTDLTIELLDRVTALEPKWAHAWNIKAQIFLELNDPLAALSDWLHTLKAESRHYIAWVGIGMILELSERDKDALKAYEKALSIHPFLPKAKRHMLNLRYRLEGQDI